MEKDSVLASRRRGPVQVSHVVFLSLVFYIQLKSTELKAVLSV